MSAARRVFALSLLSRGVLAGLYPGLSTDNHTCALQPQVLSCSEEAQPGLVDTCCVETFGGLVLQTQFWNTYTGLETEGQLLPKDSWTIHGLWPDFCNSSYTQYCDLSRQYDPAPYPTTTDGTPNGTVVEPWTGVPISDFIEPFGKYDLLAYMRKFWIGLAQDSQILWAHEFSKHATCYSTFDIECYGPTYVEHEEIVDFFTTAASYFQNLPTWGWLSAGGIRPSNTSYYSLEDIQTALSSGYGSLPYVGCSGPRYNATEAGAGSDDTGYTVLSEMWYYHHVYGAVQRGQALRVDASVTGGSVTSCATTPGAIRYYERTAGSHA
ncbi:Uu.00g017780.m01.CDS01 [Anthostomella pinea]|uniref:ribonuclease T2 n=1 Tax=Anthostomella pinea TaxID=933095 RepID=A0AAI8VYY4_9PEZI|nr:Uu.00g017780.m01.CDS01 [Anthostomella pinea]